MTDPHDATGRGAPPPLVVDGLDVSVLSEEYLSMVKAGGVSCWHKSMGGLRTFADAHTFVDGHRAQVRVARTVADVRQAHQDGALALVFGWQMADPVGNNRSGESDWWSDPPRTSLRAYYELGLRVCGIAYQVANVFGGGAVDGHVGLSRAGRRLVEEVHRLGMVLDVGGHTGEQASLDAVELSSGVPVVCSHGNARALANSSRNLSDRVVDAIAATGGVIGVVAINDFVMRGEAMAHLRETPLGTVDDMLRHAEYYRDRVGIDHVGLGPDFTWGLSPNRDRAIFGAAAMDEGPRRFVRGFENIGELPNVVRAMERRGWLAEHIEKFLGGNWLRVYERVWGR